DVDEVTLQGEVKRLFTGWMFAGSPGLHAVEHPIYDVWLTNCKGGSTVVADTQPNAPGPTQSAPAGAAKPPATQQRQQQGAGAPPPGATAAGPGAQQQQQPRPQAQRQPGTMQVPDGMQPLPPPPGSQPVQWPPRR